MRASILDNKNLVKEWKAVLPLCEACRASAGALSLVHYAIYGIELRKPRHLLKLKLSLR